PTEGHVVRLRWEGANPAAQVYGLARQEGISNYFIGNDPAKWVTYVPSYGQVAYRDVYPGIDLLYYGNSQRQLEYDFVVAPGADPTAIRLAIEGADGVRLDEQGNLVVHTRVGDVVEHAPVLYQEVNGVRNEITGRYLLSDAWHVGFQVDTYDPARPLVIDPSLSYSTYLGGSNDDQGDDIAVDA